MPMDPPKTTAQTRAVTVGRDGKPRFYEPEALKQAKEKITAHMAAFQPVEPLTGPLRLTVKWLFQGRPQKGAAHAWKTTRPDVDNLCKLLLDCMTRLKFWKDDSQVCSLIAEKFGVSSTYPGIYVKLEQLEQ